MRFLSKIIVFISALSLLWVPGNARAISPAYIGTVSQLIAPTQIPGLSLWLDAADTSTITQSGGAVSQWNDKSGKGFNATQGTGANQPTTGVDTVNGKNALKFNGTSSFISLPAGTNSFPSGANTIFAVGKSAVTTGAERDIYNNDNSSGKRSQLYINPTGGGICVATNRASGSTTAAVLGTVNTNAHILGSVYGGASSITAFFDGNTTVSASGQSTFTGGVGNAIGAFTGSSNFWSGDIGEVIIYTRALSNAEINLVGKYLAAKWGVTWTNLP